MHFSTIVAASAFLAGTALAGKGYGKGGKDYETPVYYTTVEGYETKIYTSIKTCKDKPTEKPAPVYYTPAPEVDPKETLSPYETPVTYTKYEYATVTDCGDYVKDCPAKIYTSTIYSTSTCSGAYAKPTDTYIPEEYDTPTYYVPPSNYSDPTPYPYEPSPTEYPVEYPVETEEPIYTTTIYTTVCPGKNYCYATTITTTWCPSKTYVHEYPVDTKTYVHEYPVETKTYAHEYPVDTKTYVHEYPVETKTYEPVPEYTKPAPCSGYDCPPAYNATTPTYVPPPSYTGAASTASFSFGVAAIAAVAALFIAA